MTVVCIVADCANAAHSRGWCPKHYQRWRKHGDPLHVTPTTDVPPDGVRPALAARVLARLPRGRADECWTWPGQLIRGYGIIKHLDRRYVVHRLAYEALVGPIPDGLVLDHQCFNRACCNPAHLLPATVVANSKRQREALKTECANGHAYNEANTYRRAANGRRMCRACVRERMRLRYWAKKAAA